MILGMNCLVYNLDVTAFSVFNVTYCPVPLNLKDTAFFFSNHDCLTDYVLIFKDSNGVSHLVGL